MVLMSVCILPLLTFAQHDDDIYRILALTGHADPEELDEYEVDRLVQYIAHPLKLNVASSSRLRSSGLLSPYQVASLIDYRTRHGDVLSYYELSSVDVSMRHL